ncbi:WhiB family transcriptional regulator (plasmid) [Rhodococcus pseudokoreensis]|uniref:Transcriptional regulator WhiB n=1 Tax=Rhodococcus pseudokoreensis TaxID=2811421 RepID=A0A974ZRM6_9NOCA|nr:WhiB family transcriptional regulator [Rhodococcus pseudokoreensis]QSE87597.1 WhiB family transcriptional regulator [Rhodococcus pseudokoreensis]
MTIETDTRLLTAATAAAPGWRDFALCRVTDPEAFFPETGENGRPAKRVCAGCEVREACLAEALAHDERFGIWGGLTTAERRKYHPKRRR